MYTFIEWHQSTHVSDSFRLFFYFRFRWFRITISERMDSVKWRSSPVAPFRCHFSCKYSNDRIITDLFTPSWNGYFFISISISLSLSWYAIAFELRCRLNANEQTWLHFAIDFSWNIFEFLWLTCIAHNIRSTKWSFPPTNSKKYKNEMIIAVHRRFFNWSFSRPAICGWICIFIRSRSLPERNICLLFMLTVQIIFCFRHWPDYIHAPNHLLSISAHLMCYKQ